MALADLAKRALTRISVDGRVDPADGTARPSVSLGGVLADNTVDNDGTIERNRTWTVPGGYDLRSGDKATIGGKRYRLGHKLEGNELGQTWQLLDVDEAE